MHVLGTAARDRCVVAAPLGTREDARQILDEAMLELLVEEGTAVAAIARVMSEKDVHRVMAHPTTMMIGIDAHTGARQDRGLSRKRTTIVAKAS